MQDASLRDRSRESGPGRAGPDPKAAPRLQSYAKLPAAPITASPVPHLTSLYHFDRAGEYGDRSWPGNCGGNLIKDLLNYFRPHGPVLDPMSGSGTCRDVCEDLDIPCHARDIHDDFDACDPAGFSISGTFEFIWCHPPYWRMKLYSHDTRDLSRAPTLDDFLGRYGQFLRNCAEALKPGGKLAVLMGDYHDRAEGQVPLVYHTKRLAFEAGLRQHGTEIIRFSHGNSSSKKVYQSSFIPGLHDVCTVFEKPRRPEANPPARKGGPPVAPDCLRPRRQSLEYPDDFATETRYASTDIVMNIPREKGSPQ